MVKTVVGVTLLAVVLLFGLGWLIQGNNFFLYQVFAPKYEQIRRDTFEQSKAYNQGMIQELQNMQFEYVKATPDQQAALRSIILHRAADFDVSQPEVPPDLRRFIEGLRREKGVK